MTQKMKVIIVVIAVLVVAGLVVLAFIIRGLLQPAVKQPQTTVAPSHKARTIGKDKFGPRPRPQAAANVDVGIRTINTSGGSAPPTSSPHAAVTLAQVYNPGQINPNTNPSNPNQLRTIPGALNNPSPSPSSTPAPLLPAPVFSPLPPAPAPQGKEIVVAYAKGETGKRQVFLRSLDREKDEQLVTSVFDDYGPSFSSATQKIAFYSNEEGQSDATRSKTKLKVADLATNKVFMIADKLPGIWPVAWSPDGRKLAIPTTNSIFIADTTAGNSLQIPTGKNPGAISWAPGSLKLYFQAEAGGGNTDIYEADAITAQPRQVVTGSNAETLPVASADGSKLSFLRDQPGGKTNVVVKNLTSNEETAYSETDGTASFLWNLDFSKVLFTRQSNQGKLTSLKGKEVKDVGGPAKSTVISWDRDYQHAFVIAEDGGQRTLYSVDTESGDAEKIKDGLAETPQPPPQ